MGKNSGEGYRVARGWRLVGEYAHSAGCGGYQAALAPLMGLVQTVGMLPSDLERIKLAASQALAQAEHTAAHQPARSPLVVWVFVSASTESALAPRSWGCFVLERGSAERGDSGVDADRIDDRLVPHVIELYIYAEGSPA